MHLNKEIDRLGKELQRTNERKDRHEEGLVKSKEPTTSSAVTEVKESSLHDPLEDLKLTNKEWAIK